MAKVVPSTLQPETLPFVRGRVLFLKGPYGWVAQKWPRKRGKPKTPYDYYRQTEFGNAAKLTAYSTAVEQESARLISQGSGNVPRDYLTASILGLGMQIEMEDGTRLIPTRYVSNNPQYVLDLVTTEVGSLLYRRSDGWMGLPLADSGYVLTIENGLPAWVEPPYFTTIRYDEYANLEAGYSSSLVDLGTKSSGTLTPDVGDGAYQKYVNGGAHTLALPDLRDGDAATLILQVTNNGSAGTITTSAYTKVTGDPLTLTNGHDFFLFVTVIGAFSNLHVVALQ